MMEVADDTDYSKDNDNERGDIQHYAFSTTRSMTSAFFSQMLTENQVVLVFSSTGLSYHNKVRPHVDQAAREEMGRDYNEMEERIYSDKPVLQLKGPINRIITKVLYVDMTDPAVFQRAGQYQRNKFSPQGLKELLDACRSAGIPTQSSQSVSQMRGGIVDPDY